MRALITLSILSSLVAVADAQPVATPPEPPLFDEDAKPKLRGGFAVGAGLGLGRFAAGEGLSELSGGAGSILLRVGTTATDDLLWSFQFEAASRRGQLGEDEFALGYAALSLGAQYYFRPKLYVRGGLGLGSLQQKFDANDIADNEDGALILSLGGGYDLYRRGRFVVDVQLNLTGGKFRDENLSVSGLQIGANWY